MMDGYRPCGRRLKCPICDRFRTTGNVNTWCLISNDGLSAICPRIPCNPDDHDVGRVGEAGWLHDLSSEQQRAVAEIRLTPEPKPRTIDAPAIMGRMQAEIDEQWTERYADSLGLCRTALERLGIGRAFNGDAAFPMRDGYGITVGIRLRKITGQKYAVTGSRSGLFYAGRPKDISGQVYITEGPTDTAACGVLGLTAVGRPSCSGGAGKLADLFRESGPVERIVVADRDGPGRDGARMIARALGRCKIITPPSPFKDMRDWVQGGATRRIVEYAAQNSRVVAA
ncbi:MAG: hypothetical protein AAGB51_12375 [Planctomycetota bacterium]